MTTAVTPGREELAIEVMNVRRRIHGLDDLDLTTLRRIKRDAGINEAFAIADALLARLAAKPSDELREAISKAYYTQRTYDKNSGAHIVSFGFNSKDDAIALESLSTTGEKKP